MKGSLVICSVAAIVLHASASAALAASASGTPSRSGSSAQQETVNSYTPQQERRARQAVQRAGYTPQGGLWSQAGYIFMNATRQGQWHQITVSPDGQVFASNGVSISQATAPGPAAR